MNNYNINIKFAVDWFKNDDVNFLHTKINENNTDTYDKDMH